MFQTFAWSVALLIDIAALVAIVASLFGAADMAALWLVAIAAAFAILSAALLDKRRVNPAPRLRVAGQHMCWVLPAIFLGGSLDHLRISGQEMASVIVLAIVGALNWVGLRPRTVKHA